MSLSAANEPGEFLANLKIGMVDVNNDIAVLVPSTAFDIPAGLNINKSRQISPQQQLKVIGHPSGINLNIKTVLAGNPVFEKLTNLIPPVSSRTFQQRNSPFEQVEVIYLEGNLVPGHSGSSKSSVVRHRIGPVN